jgi:hypothetical protein
MPQAISKPASLIQRLVTGVAVSRCRNPDTGQIEVLLRWTGSQGETHEIWYPQDQIHFEGA